MSNLVTFFKYFKKIDEIVQIFGYRQILSNFPKDVENCANSGKYFFYEVDTIIRSHIFLNSNRMSQLYTLKFRYSVILYLEILRYLPSYFKFFAKFCEKPMTYLLNFRKRSDQNSSRNKLFFSNKTEWLFWPKDQQSKTSFPWSGYRRRNPEKEISSIVEALTSIMRTLEDRCKSAGYGITRLCRAVFRCTIAIEGSATLVKGYLSTAACAPISTKLLNFAKSKPRERRKSDSTRTRSRSLRRNFRISRLQKERKGKIKLPRKNAKNTTLSFFFGFCSPSSFFSK